MDKRLLASKIFYLLAAISFIVNLITKESGYMACGGLLMIIASLLMMSSKKDK